MYQKPKESDWKHFNAMTVDLRERYLKEKNQKLVQMLTASGKKPSAQFWDTFDQMNKEKKILVDCLDGHSRSKMTMCMALMLRYGMLKKEDLEGFSEELQNQMSHYLKS